MGEKRSYRSWTISDELWDRIKDQIPKKERDPAKTYRNNPGQGAEKNESAESVRRDFLCAADRMPVERRARRVWLWEQFASLFSRVAKSRLL